MPEFLNRVRICAGGTKLALEFAICILSSLIASELAGSSYVHNAHCRVIFYEYEENIEMSGFQVGGGRVFAIDLVDYTIIGNRPGACDEECFVGLAVEPLPWSGWNDEPDENYAWTESVNLVGADPESCKTGPLCPGGDCRVVMAKGDPNGVSSDWLFAPGFLFFMLKLMTAASKATDAWILGKPSMIGFLAPFLASMVANIALLPISQLRDTSASPSHVVAMQGEFRQFLTVWTGVFIFFYFLYSIIRLVLTRLCEKQACYSGAGPLLDAGMSVCACPHCCCNLVLVIATGNFSLLLCITISFALNFPEFGLSFNITVVKILSFIVWLMDICEAGMSIMSIRSMAQESS